MSSADFLKGILATRESLYAAYAANNKTIASAQKSANDSITSEIKKVIGALAKVNRTEVTDELVLVGTAIGKFL